MNMTPTLNWNESTVLGSRYVESDPISVVRGDGVIRLSPAHETTPRGKTKPVRFGKKQAYTVMFVATDKYANHATISGSPLLESEAKKAAELWLNGITFMTDEGRVILHKSGGQGPSRVKATNPPKRVRIGVIESIESAQLDAGDIDATRVYYDSDPEWEDVQDLIRSGKIVVVDASGPRAKTKYVEVAMNHGHKNKGVPKKKSKARSKAKRMANPTSEEASNIRAVFGLPAIALGIASIVFLIGGFYYFSTKRRAGLPPRADNKPSPAPIKPATVPSEVKQVVIPTPPADPWKFYGWYSYTGAAPQKMWIRVDWKGYTAGPGGTIESLKRHDDVFGSNMDSAASITVSPNQFRWTIVVANHTYIAQGVMDRSVTIECTENKATWFIPGGFGGCAAAFEDTLDSEGRIKAGPFKALVEEWVIPSAAQLASRDAADWIDLAFTLPSLEEEMS